MKGIRKGRTWHIYLDPHEVGTLGSLQRELADLEIHGFRVDAVEFTQDRVHIVCEYDEVFHRAAIGR